MSITHHLVRALPLLALGVLAGASPASAAAKPKHSVAPASHAKPTPQVAKPVGKPKGKRGAASQVEPKTWKARPVDGPRYILDVQFVLTADDDGARAATLTKPNAEAAIAFANAIYRRNGGDVAFKLHDATNFGAPIRRTVLNRDCILGRGQTEATIAANTTRDLNGDGEATNADRDLLCDYSVPRSARVGYAVERADRIIVFARGGNDRVKWDNSKGHWVLSHPSGGASSANGYYVRMPKSFAGSKLLAHELGHYLHTAHTFARNPRTVADAAERMEKYAARHPTHDPRRVFDGDSHVTFAVSDTPPDPGGALLEDVHGDKCDPNKGSVSVRITVDGKNRRMVLAPDRANVMSYFGACGFPAHLSKGQYAQVHLALYHGNRRGLVESKGSSCYASGSEPGDLPTDAEKLALQIRRISRCLLAQKQAVPWEAVMQKDVYTNPAARKRGRGRAGRTRVNKAREREMVKKILGARFVR